MAVTLTGPPYRTSNNIWMTASLFHERSIMLEEANRSYEPVFSLDEDYQGLVNARATYISLMDVTGYSWAMKYLNSWTHWEKLIKCHWFREKVELWNEEIKTILKQQALQKITEIASGGSPQAYQAAKYLAQGDFDKPPHGRGRPSKEELRGELAKAARVLSQETEDAERIGLRVVQGGLSPVLQGGKSPINQ